MQGDSEQTDLSRSGAVAPRCLPALTPQCHLSDPQTVGIGRDVLTPQKLTVPSNKQTFLCSAVREGGVAVTPLLATHCSQAGRGVTAHTCRAILMRGRADHCPAQGVHRATGAPAVWEGQRGESRAERTGLKERPAAQTSV